MEQNKELQKLETKYNEINDEIRIKENYFLNYFSNFDEYRNMKYQEEKRQIDGEKQEEEKISSLQL